MKPRFNPLAERELDDAFQYYEEHTPGLGERFLDEVEHALIFLRRHPEAAPRVLGSIRRFVLPLFPYSILYRPSRMAVCEYWPWDIRSAIHGTGLDESRVI
jgi:plasmid stabilization system protein ParE